jgi:hypothetical protein
VPVTAVAETRAFQLVADAKRTSMSSTQHERMIVDIANLVKNESGIRWRP